MYKKYGTRTFLKYEKILTSMTQMRRKATDKVVNLNEENMETLATDSLIKSSHFPSIKWNISTI